jgi:hypothetical protein
MRMAVTAAGVIVTVLIHAMCRQEKPVLALLRANMLGTTTHTGTTMANSLAKFMERQKT